MRLTQPRHRERPARMRMVRHIVDAALDGAPLWRVLEERLNLSDIAIKRAKRVPGAIALNGEPSRTNAIVCAGQEVAVAIDDATLGPRERYGEPVEPQPGPLDVVFEDEDLAVLNKPAGLVVHPCSGQRRDTLGNYLQHHLRERGVECALHPVHRLDVGTTGLIAFATSGYVQARLQAQIEQGTFVREYLAICTGRLPEPEGLVKAPIGRVGLGPRSWDVRADGRPATTRYQVLRELSGAEGPLALVRLRLLTGRTHQARVHMAHLGCPLLGDEAYGKPSQLMGRAALHSWRLRCVQPVTGEPLELEAAVPEDMAGVIG